MCNNLLKVGSVYWHLLSLHEDTLILHKILYKIILLHHCAETKDEAAKKEQEIPMDVTEMKQKPAPTPLNTDDLLLLVDLFYLPYNHGQQAKQIVSDFKWLKFNAIKEDSQEFMELTEQEQKTKVHVCVHILSLSL